MVKEILKKGKFALFLCASISMMQSTSFAKGNNLSGKYLVNDCSGLYAAIVPAVAVQPLEIEIDASSSEVDYGFLVNTDLVQGGIASQDIDSLAVGRFSGVCMGDCNYLEDGEYSTDGNTFAYSEYDNQQIGDPLVELRSTTITRTGNNVTIDYHEVAAGSAPDSICHLTYSTP